MTPSRIIKCNGKYYVYYSGNNILVRTSTDLINWKTEKAVLDRVPDWARKAVPAATNDHVWAPDIIFLNNKYYLYYSFSTFGSKISVTAPVDQPNAGSDKSRLQMDRSGAGPCLKQQERFQRH
jgi:arabinan endo-1,5-alpha-L-arabinosidase